MGAVVGDLQKFREWLVEELGLSERTAGTYMRCVRASLKRKSVFAIIRDPESPRTTRTLYRAALVHWASFQQDDDLYGQLKSRKLAREVKSGSRKLSRKVRPIPPDQMHRFNITLEALRHMENVPSWVWPSVSLFRKLALRAGVDLCQIRREAVIEALETGVLQIWTKGERVRELPTGQVQEELQALLDLGDWEVLAEHISPRARPSTQLKAAYDMVSTYLRAIASAAGIDAREVHSHRFRHTRALELYRSSKDLRAVQKFLGHKSLETTQHYLHIALTEVDDYLKELE